MGSLVRKTPPFPIQRSTSEPKPVRPVGRSSLLASASLLAAAASLLACGASQPQSTQTHSGCMRPGQVDPMANPQAMPGGMMPPQMNVPGPIQPESPPMLPGEPPAPGQPVQATAPSPTPGK